eukprot:5673719-Lingulodinium_polyedra.AAC.1
MDRSTRTCNWLDKDNLARCLTMSLSSACPLDTARTFGRGSPSASPPPISANPRSMRWAARPGAGRRGQHSLRWRNVSAQ